MLCGELDLDHSDQGDGIAGQDGAVRPVAVEETADVDAEPEPSRECDDEQLALLGEQPGDHKRRDHPDDGAEDAVDGLLVGLSSGLQCENADGHRSGRGPLELQPERRVQCHHHGGPDPQRKRPGGERKPRKGRHATDIFHESHG